MISGAFKSLWLEQDGDVPKIRWDFWSHIILRSNSRCYETINYDFCLNKLLICCLLIVSKIVVKLRYWVGLGM